MQTFERVSGAVVDFSLRPMGAFSINRSDTSSEAFISQRYRLGRKLVTSQTTGTLVRRPHAGAALIALTACAAISENSFSFPVSGFPLSFAEVAYFSDSIEFCDEIEVSLNMDRDANLFKNAIPCEVREPLVFVAEDEIGFEWINEDKRAFVSIEGDGILRYTMLVGESFVSGSEQQAPCNKVPEDLMAYLMA